uniref:Reverse transcriptase domain-containing protein n=1 Tax=Phytophthora ramorum TaxID=164328 RepID=H3H4Y5_PHYRM
MSLPVTSWKRFARELHDGRIEQICILSDVERMTCEAEELNQLISESADTLSAKSKKERFDEQGWDSLKASPFYKVLREYKDVLPDEITAELPQDKGVQHEIDLVPGTKYCVTRQWPLPREQVKAIDDFFESRRKAGQVRESKSPHSAPTFCVKKPQGGTLDLRDGFYQILMRESDIPLTAVSTPSGMLWEWLVMPQGLKNAPATFNRCVTHLLRSVRDFAPSYFDDVFIHSRAVNGRSDVEMHTEHLRKLLELMRKHKLYANLKKCIFGATEIPVLGCLVGKNGVRPDPGKVRVINEWPTPSNVKELRQFLGLATYLCKYVSNYAGKVRPLSQLLKKEAAWEWTADCQQAFEAVKQGLTEAPILAVADQDRPFHVVVIVWFTTNRVS